MQKISGSNSTRARLDVINTMFFYLSPTSFLKPRLQITMVAASCNFLAAGRLKTFPPSKRPMGLGWDFKHQCPGEMGFAFIHQCLLVTPGKSGVERRQVLRPKCQRFRTRKTNVFRFSYHWNVSCPGVVLFWFES